MRFAIRTKKSNMGATVGCTAGSRNKNLTAEGGKDGGSKSEIKKGKDEALARFLAH